VEQAGTPEELYENPENLFVGGFIGSPRMNFLRAKVAAPGRIALDGGATLAAAGAGPAAEAPLLVGVRPEHFVLPAGADVVLDFRVDVVENLGGTRYLYGTLPSGEALVVEGRDLPRPKSGDAIKIGFTANRALLFSTSGERLRLAN
jgi:lactose/L-arabinose transport system ATP-binding protein